MTKKYGLLDKTVLVIHFTSYAGNYYCASLLNGGPKFFIKISNVKIPEDQRVFTLLYNKKVS